jgi:hypothetical protein
VVGGKKLAIIEIRRVKRAGRNGQEHFISGFILPISSLLLSIIPYGGGKSDRN